MPVPTTALRVAGLGAFGYVSGMGILDQFHPAVTEWFRETLGPPTLAQERGWEAIRSGRHTLIAAPTGSGKTLAAFLTALDDLIREGQQSGSLPDETRVLYVSPLKALSTDIEQNLGRPLDGIRRVIEREGGECPTVRTAVRTGDTPSSARANMVQRPPHVLVTTPESLYLLLTAERSRQMLRSVRTVIVDEIHAIIDSRRGSHLMLSLERLTHVTHRRPIRIGLSATQRPIDEVARFLVGTAHIHRDDTPDCVIVDEGHRRALDLALEIPPSPLEAVMAAEVWMEVYERLAALIREHRTTLVFVNTRRMAERVAKELSDRLGEDAVTAHHGSLSKEKRLDGETRLREGRLSALVATASLELGIDIGHVDLVCQLGSTRWIATLLQRVGRSGHTVAGTPKGRLFPLTRDDLVECAALIRAIREGELDCFRMAPKPLDILAQQVVAEVACEEWDEDALFDLVRNAYPYRHLSAREFAEVVQMVSRGFTTRRGRRGALIHYDGVHRRLRARRGSRLAAITAGGAIPDNADYRVVLEPEETFLGTVNEDFAVESMAGDVFQLGNASWRILQVNSGTVRVADAAGELPSIPFWFGEAPGRSDELSAAVARLRSEMEARLDDPEATTRWLVDDVELPQPAAHQLTHYLADARGMLGVLPTHDAIVLERFFDESGGMQLVLHAPFGSRINKAWGLALRKRFCRQFNFELQAAATENGLVLSLGPQHSFPLDDVFRYLHPDRVRDILIQALFDAPVFQTRWRWNVTLALAVLRNQGGRRVPPPLQRMQSEDLLAAVFPDAAACLENIGGDREVPDHPLVRQTIADCLDEGMDLEGLLGVLHRIFDGSLRCVARDTPEPSALCAEILNAQPYAFLDDAPLEERRTQAVRTRRAFEPSSANELGALDADAIARVQEEAWPDPRDADEMHDALLLAGFLTDEEVQRHAGWPEFLAHLQDTELASRVGGASDHAFAIWVAAERTPELRLVFGDAIRFDPTPPSLASEADAASDRETAVKELVRGRMEISGPVAAAVIASALGVDVPTISTALIALETEGVVLRGSFTPGYDGVEWCHRRLLSRIHRYTLNRLRAEIQPVAPADFMRFLLDWQHVAPEQRMAGPEGLRAVITQLDGFELPAAAWEADVLSARVSSYDPLWLDTLCLTGAVTWRRLSPPNREGAGPFTAGPVRSTPIALSLREHVETWHALTPQPGPASLSSYAQAVLPALIERGASFFPEIVEQSGLLATQVENALGELVAHGFVTSDSFAGLRILLTPSNKRPPRGGGRRRGRTTPFGVESAGRWSVTGRGRQAMADQSTRPADAWDDLEGNAEDQAWVLLRRYGVVFRRLLAREANLAPWRVLTQVLRRLEARGEIRGGRFVGGMSGEQFALPEAVAQLRAVRRAERDGRLIGISAADPLNLTGVVFPGHRVPALAGNRVVFRDGVPIAAREAGTIRPLADYDSALERDVERAIVRRDVSPTLRAYLGKAG